MKKSMLALCAWAFSIHYSDAQISKGGFPLSAESKATYANIPQATYANPDWAAYLQTEKNAEARNKPFLVALHTPADFGFPESGRFIHLENGQTIWKGRIFIDNAPAIGLMYDRFKLPKGVKLFLTNENGQQVLGAFDAENNDRSGTFVTDAVQGNIVNIELNIAANIDINEIQLHIDRAAVFHRAISHLRPYAGNDIALMDHFDSTYNGTASRCMINAICPQGSNYSNSRKATVQLIWFEGQQGVVVCSGTLVNNTGNTSSSCKPYLLTATHCESTGSFSNATFNQTLVRFNFEHSACTGSPAPSSQSMTGLDVVARSKTDPVVADFMLLAFRAPIPAAYGAVLSGWNNNPAIPTTVTEPKKFIGFHHPDGDNKKLSFGHEISSVSSPQLDDIDWDLNIEEGYIAGGASGSGLFDGDGYLIGDLSGGTNFGGRAVPDSCNQTQTGGPTSPINTVAGYSKFSSAWDYAFDGTANNRKLKPWLDPAGTNAVTLPALSSSCTAIGTTSIKQNDELDQNISIFPNPNTGALLKVQYNLNAAQDMSIRIMDVNGRTVLEKKLQSVKTGSTTINIATLASGIYLLKFDLPSGFTTKKLLINK